MDEVLLISSFQKLSFLEWPVPWEIFPVPIHLQTSQFLQDLHLLLT